MYVIQGGPEQSLSAAQVLPQGLALPDGELAGEAVRGHGNHFGLRHGASAYQRRTEAVIEAAQEKDINAAPYIDDTAGAAVPQVAECHYVALTDSMTELGAGCSHSQVYATDNPTHLDRSHI